MAQRKKGFADNYRTPLILAVLLLFGSIAHGQSFTGTSAWGYDWNAGKFRTLLAIPADTFAVPSAFQGLPFIARKAGRTFYWDITAHRWDIDTASGSGSSGGGGVDVLTKQNFTDTSTYDATRWWVLSQLSNYTPLSRFLDSMTAARLRYLKASDTAYLHNQIVNLTTNSAANSNLIFSDGLVWSSVDNHVRAQFASPIWNANRIQGYSVSPTLCNGCVPYLDSASLLIRWRLPDSASLVPVLARMDSIGWYAQGPYLKTRAGNVVGDRDTAYVDETALRTLIESYQTDGSVVTGPDLSIDSVKITGDAWKTFWMYRSSGRIDTAGFFDRSGPAGTGTVTGGKITWPGAIFNTPTTATVTSGTLNFSPTLATQPAGYVLAAPKAASGVPSFRKLEYSEIGGAPLRGLLYADGSGGFAATDSLYWVNSNHALQLLSSYNGSSGYSVTNTSTGASAEASLTAANNVGTLISLKSFGSGNADARFANRGMVIGNNGISMFSYAVAGPLPPNAGYKFYLGLTQNSTTPSLQIKGNRHVLVPSPTDTTDDGIDNHNLQVRGSLVVRDTLFATVVSAGGTVTGGGGGSYTDAQARAAISLTTTGTSGAATYNSTTGVLNIPQYSGGTGGGYTEFKEEFTALTTTTKTLAHAPAFPNATLLFYDNGSGFSVQSSTWYSISGTTLTLNFTPSATDRFIIKYSY